MFRPVAILPFLLLSLAACPVDHVILSAGEPEGSTSEPGTGGMSSTSEPSDTFVGSETGEPDPTTGSPTGCEDASLEQVCADHPFERAPGCGEAPDEACQDVLAHMAAEPACAGLDLCDYAACADALADEACTARPPECGEIVACLNHEEPAAPNCCDEHGTVDGAPGLCATTADHKCVDCDGMPVLCMTHGCGTVGVEDCCLSDDGETVPCEQGIVEVPGPIILACNPPATLCGDLEADCIDAGIDDERCMQLAQGVCPADKCVACERMLDACDEADIECDTIAKRCSSALDGCDCGSPTCHDMTTAAAPELFASCFAWPLALGCEEPSAGQCFTTMSYAGCAGLTTCEYNDCMRALDARASCTDAVPAACAEVVACVEAEASPWD
jgi:hypothetical protein